MKAHFILVIAIFFALISCKKSSSSTDASPKFMNLTSGSVWNYTSTNNLTATTVNNIVTATNKDTSINNKTYHIFTNSNGAVNDYYNITGNDYYTFKNISNLTTSLVENIYLKDNSAVGVNWSQTINANVPGIPTVVPITFTNTISEYNISRTVNNIVYTGVTHIITTISISGLPAGSLITDIQSYYAPNVGLIENKNKILLPLASINLDQSTILKSSVLK